MSWEYLAVTPPPTALLPVAVPGLAGKHHSSQEIIVAATGSAHPGPPGAVVAGDGLLDVSLLIHLRRAQQHVVQAVKTAAKVHFQAG